MDVYQEYLNLIDEYSRNEYFVSNNETISVFKLLELIKEVSELLNMLSPESDYIKQINRNINENLMRHKMEDIINNSVTLSNIKSEKVLKYLFNKFYADSIDLKKYRIVKIEGYQGCIKINIEYGEKTTYGLETKSFELYKMVDATIINYDSKLDDYDFLKKNYDTFLELFDLIAKCYSIFGDEMFKSYVERNVIKNEYFIIGIGLTGYGRYYFDIDVNKGVTFSRDLIALNKIFFSNQNAILKNVFVNIDELIGITRKIVENHFNEKSVILEKKA